MHSDGESWSRSMGHNREPLVSNLVKCVAQDWIAARLHSREQPLQASLLPVKHAGGTRVSVPVPCVTSQDVVVPSRDLGGCTGSREAHVAESLGGTATAARVMEFCLCLFSGLFPSLSRSRWCPILETFVAITILCPWSIYD